MANKIYVILSIGIISGITSYLIYPEVGIMSALVVMFAVSWFSWRFSDLEKTRYTLGYLIKPPIAGFMIFLGTFLYLSFNGYSSANTWLYSFGISLLGGLISIMLNTTWNIGG